MHLLSQKRADIQSQGATRERSAIFRALSSGKMVISQKRATSCEGAFGPLLRVSSKAANPQCVPIRRVWEHLGVASDAQKEKFSEPEPNVIESSEGFSVSVLGRTGMRYSEGGRSVCIDSEVLAKPRAIAMSKGSIRLWEGSAGTEVGDHDRDRIAANIKRAFDACGYELEVHEPLDWSSVAVRPPSERPR